MGLGANGWEVIGQGEGGVSLPNHKNGGKYALGSLELQPVVQRLGQLQEFNKWRKLWWAMEKDFLSSCSRSIG